MNKYIMGIAFFTSLVLYSNCSNQDNKNTPVVSLDPSEESPQATLEKLPPVGDSILELTNQNFVRRALVYRSAYLNEENKIPVIFALHGGGGNLNKTRINTNSGFDKLADTEQFLVIYPEAILNDGDYGGHWNDGRNLADYKSHSLSIDDVGYFEALIESLANKYSSIDTSRIFFSGASNGGMMVQRLACELPVKITGFAAVMSALPKNLQASCTPTIKRPMLFVNGTADPLMRYNSEFVHSPNGTPNLGERLTVPDTLTHWNILNGCNLSPQSTTPLPDINTSDDSKVILLKYSCAGFDNLFFRVDNGGHTWPGSPPQSKIGEKLVGKTNQDINAPKEIWSFFKDLESIE